MAFFNPLGALSAAGSGALKGYTEDAPKIYDMMGMQALGNAFKLPQGPIAPIPGIGQPGPTPPMPGQPSAPAQPPPMQSAGGPLPPGPPVGGGGGPPVSAGAGGPMPQQGGPPMPPGGAGPPMPQGGGPPMGGQPQPGAQGGPQQPSMPQFDLQTLTQRIQQANPNLPPQALVAALTRAVPLLNVQGRQELAQMRLDMQRQNLDLRRDTLDVRERQGDRRLDQADTREGRLTEQGDRRLGQGDRRLEMAQAGLDEKRREFDAREARISLRAQEQAESGMSPDAKADAAKRYNSTGTLPSLGWGSQARKDKADILNIATQQRQTAGLSVDRVIKDQQKLKAEQVGIQRFMSGPQGNVTRSLGVVVDHLGTMRDLTTALENGDMQLFNRVRQSWLEQTGSELPTDVQAAAQIVGAEIIKALGVAGAGTEKERSEAANIFSTAKSPEQLRGAIGTVQPLLGGQLKGLRRQFISATGLPGEEFDAMIGTEAMKFLGGGQPRTEYVMPGQGQGASADPMDAAKQKLREGMTPPKVTGPGGWSAQRVQ